MKRTKLVTTTFHQDPDCCQSGFDLQNISIEEIDGGSGVYYLISTERWAIESIDDLVSVLMEAGVKQGNDGGAEILHTVSISGDEA